MAIRTNQLVNFKGEPYATVPEVENKISEVSTTLQEQISEAVQNSKISVSGSTGTPEDGSNILQSLKVIGDCKIIYGNDGQITLRIGPALNSSLFNGTDGITTATVSYVAPSIQTASLSEYYSANDFIGTLTDRKIVVNQDGDVVKANCGTGKTSINATTGAVTKGNEVHFQGDGTCKFKVYVNAYGKDFPFVVGPITKNLTYNVSGIVTDPIYILTKDEKFVENKEYYKKDDDGNYVLDEDVQKGQTITEETYYELVQLGQTYSYTSDTKFTSGKKYYIFENGSFVEATVVAGNDVTSKTYFEKKQLSYVSCAVTNYRQQTKTDSGASGYCANVNFTFIPENLFQSDVDFKLVKIEQIQVSGTKESVVATWNNSDTVNYVYLIDYKSLPGKPSSASYVLSAQTTTNTKKISGITYLTTSTTMTPSAQGLFNCGYPGYITNKLNCAPSGGSWCTAFNEQSIDSFTTWTTKKGTPMDWEGTAKYIAKGKYENPQITVYGINMHGNGTSITSTNSNNKLIVVDPSGYTSSTHGSISQSGRLDNTFATKDFSTIDLSAEGNTDLQIENGYIVYPSTDYRAYNKDGQTEINPNYSGLTGDRYYYVKLSKTGTIMGGTVTITTAASAETALKQSKDDQGNWVAKLKVQLSNDKTNWMDIGRTSTDGGIGATFEYGTSNKISFSIPNASYYGNGFLYARVTMTSDAGVKIANITLG